MSIFDLFTLQPTFPVESYLNHKNNIVSMTELCEATKTLRIEQTLVSIRMLKFEQNKINQKLQQKVTELNELCLVEQ